jgi:beta-glucosidase
MFSFGHGLSYTRFEIDDVVAAERGANVVLSARLANVGERKGTEVIQVFAKDIGDVDRRLAGFAKVHLEAGESAAIEVPISHEQLRWWNPAGPGWTPATGKIEFEIRGTFGTAAATAKLSGG